MLKSIGIEDIEDLARGAVLLGTGGGGDPYVGELCVQSQLKRSRSLSIIPVDDLDDDAFVVSLAGIGSPPVLLEHLVSERTLATLFARTEQFFDRHIDAIISAEIGGANAMFPLAVGAIAGIPVVDGDGIGRAMPHIEMTTFSIFGCRATPAVMLDDLGNCLMLEMSNDRIAEEVCRAATQALGSIAYGTFYPMSGREVKRCCVRDTLTLALDIGRCIRMARQTSDDVVGELVRFLSTQPNRVARLLFDGKVTDVRHETRDGWHWGLATLAGLAGWSGTFTVEIQNEFLVARHDGNVVATVPDLISLVDRESGEPLTAEMLSYGQRVKVIGFSADPLLSRTESLAVLGPRAFGLDHDYAPLCADQTSINVSCDTRA